MKILFVIVDNYKMERLGVQILSTIAIEEGYERQLLILNSMSSSDEAVKTARDYKPDIVAYSGMTYEHIGLQKFNRLLKKSGLDFISIFGGVHYTFSPEEIRDDPFIDVLCRGEGEIAWRSFIKAVRDGQSFHRIEKLLVRHDGDLIENPVGKLITDMDQIPWADRTLIDVNDGDNRLLGKSYAVMFGRGCPQKCTYCFNVSYNDLFSDSRIFRLRSVDDVLAEIKQIVKQGGVDYIAFYDDIFSYIPKKVMVELFRRYKEEINIPFCATFRAESVNEKMVVMMKEAGLFLASMGVESGNEEVARGFLERGKITNQDIINAMDLFNKHGVKVWTLNLMAIPVDDPLTVDWETIDLNIKIKPHFSQWNIVVPYPNTPIWDYLIENNLLDAKAFMQSDKMPSSFTKTQVLFKTPGIARKVNNLHKFAGIVVKYPFLRPLVKILILFPENRIYLYIFLLWYGYWKSVGTFNLMKPSLMLFINGWSAIRKYLRQH